MKTIQDFLKDLAEIQSDFGQLQVGVSNDGLYRGEHYIQTPQNLLQIGELCGRCIHYYFGADLYGVSCSASFFFLALHPKVCEVWFGKTIKESYATGDEVLTMDSLEYDPDLKIYAEPWVFKRQDILQVFDQYCLQEITYQEATQRVLKVFYENKK